MNAADKAERALLAALIFEGANYDDLTGIVGAEDFADPNHRILYRAVEALSARQGTIDGVGILAHLEATGAATEAVGGLLEGLAVESCAAVNAMHYASTIAKVAQLRRLERACTQGAELARQPRDMSPGEAAAAIEAGIIEAAAGSQAGGFVRATDALSAVIAELDRKCSAGGELAGISTGITDLDRVLSGLSPGQLVIVGGRPGMGKSALALSIARIVARSAPVAYFSLEMTIAELIERAISAEGRVNLHRLRSGKLSEQDWAAVASASKHVDALELHIDEQSGVSAADVRSRCRRLSRKLAREGKALGLVVIDYLQLMGTPKAETRALELAKTTMALKELAKELGAPVVALSQLNRGVEHRQNQRPTLADLRESGSLEQDADAVVFVYRPDKAGEPNAKPGDAELIVAKHRNGPTGAVRCAFLSEQAAFVNYAEDHAHADFD